jgi:hypothetical protein
MRIQAQLERIERDLAKVSKHVAQYEGIDARQAFNIGRTCDGICETAAIIGGAFREAEGRKGAKERLVKKVRAALGFLYP